MSQPPLVALHGFLGCAADWDAIFEHLRKDRPCIAIDLPGHGNEPMPPPGEELQVIAEKLVEATAGLGVVDYLGYSMGGRVLYQLATDPRLMPWGKMVLVGAHPGLEGEEERAARRLQDGFTAQQLDEGDFADFLDDWYDLPLFGDIKRTPGYPALVERRLQNDPHSLARALRRLGTGVLPSRWSVLGEIRHPLLLLAGERDEKYRRLNERAAQRAPDAAAAIVPRTSHAPQIEAPADVAAIVRAFLGA